MLKKIMLLLGLSLILTSSYADKNQQKEATEIKECSNEALINSKYYAAMLWYRNSAEMKALYRQIFSNAEDTISNTIIHENLKPKTWGIALALDATLLDDSGYALQKLNNCNPESVETRYEYETKHLLPATPGATELSCGIQELGGKVFIVTNRTGGGENGINTMAATIQNLNHSGICYDSVIFANDSNDSNKNPRFNAITSGDYENVISTKQQLATPLIAYFGSNIQDFPNLKQNILHNVNGNNEEFDSFGAEYFMLPNPISGSWQENQLQ